MFVVVAYLLHLGNYECASSTSLSPVSCGLAKDGHGEFFSFYCDYSFSGTPLFSIGLAFWRCARRRGRLPRPRFGVKIRILPHLAPITYPSRILQKVKCNNNNYLFFFCSFFPNIARPSKLFAALHCTS